MLLWGEPRAPSGKRPCPSPQEAPHLVTHRPRSGTKRNSSAGGRAGPPRQPQAEPSAEEMCATRRQRQLVPETPGEWQPRGSSHQVFTPCAQPAPLPPASWPHTSASRALSTEHRREGTRQESSGQRWPVENRSSKRHDSSALTLLCSRSLSSGNHHPQPPA